MRRTTLLALMLAFAVALQAQDNVPVETGSYKPTWESLSQWECPEWFRDTKFGIWAHWGPQCQAESGDWYARHMYYPGEWQNRFHVEHYGDPAQYGLKELIRDWKAEEWNPDELVRLYKDAGAQFFMTLGQHHDNFDLWDSPYQEWNSVNIGPKRDIVGEWAKACKKYKLPLGISMHGSHAWTWLEGSQRYDGNLTKADGKGQWWEGMDPQALYAQRHEHSTGWERAGSIHAQWEWKNGASIPSQAYMQNFQNRVLQCINKYDPKVLYFDDTVLPFYGCNEQVGLNILTHYYNHTANRHKGEADVVVTGKILKDVHKQAMMWDVERGIPDRCQPMPWQTCTCIGSWHYERGLYNRNGYKSAATVIRMLVDVVSKNGTLLLSIPIRANGTIDEKERAIVNDIKAWMDINKKSIYDTRPWKTFGEGPLAESSNPLNAQGFNEGIKYSAKDVRYVQKGKNRIYATIMMWPEAGDFTLKALKDEQVKGVRLLGYGKLNYRQGGEGLIITLPAEHPNEIAPVIEITYDPNNKSGDSACTLTSPKTGIQTHVEMLSGVPYLIIKDKAGKQVSKVQLGFNTNEDNFSTGITLVGATKPVSFTEQYHAFHGKCAEVSNAGKRMTINFKNQKGTPFNVEVCAYDNGVTFRYDLANEAGKTLTFANEQTNYEMPATAHRWLQPFNTSYEADIPFQAGAGKTGTWCFPALFESDGLFTLITEANIGRSYCSTHLDNKDAANKYQVSYPFAYEGYNKGEVNPSCKGPWKSPWRVLIIGSLKTIVESTLVEDVSESCRLANTDFVKPGRAAWVYWAYNHGTKDYKICCQYVDLAARMGWEYVLFDWEWETMGNGGNLEDAVNYAKSKGIKPMIWYHSNNPKMQNHDERIKEFQWHNSIGVAGIKVDFFESDKQHTMQYFADILEDAAQYGIMVNFHGCTVPRGWSRTYPNLMSQEAVFGAEQYNNGPIMTTEGARINCSLAYMRNVIGPMDYTPVAFTNSQHPHTTTFAHELALSVVFESGIQHWADRPEGFYALPEEAQTHMRNVPVAWDETRFLDGYPGQSFVVARRKADVWYVAGLNGKNTDTAFSVPLTFLGKGNYEATLIGDGANASLLKSSQTEVNKKKTISVDCLGKGGFVLTLRPK